MSKNPITDPGKKSKKGRLTLELQNGEFTTVQEGNGDPEKVSLSLLPHPHFLLLAVYELGFLY